MDRLRFSLLALLSLGGRVIRPFRLRVSRSSRHAMSFRRPFGWNHFSPRRRLVYASTSRRPLLAKDPGYMLSTPAPVFIDRGLNWNDVVSGDGPFSDGNGQHSHYISERARGRR